jgi:hypothetical protein
MALAAFVFDLALVAVGAFLLGSGICEVATGRRPPGVLGRSPVNPAATAQFVEGWTDVDWRHNGARLTGIGMVLFAAGIVVLWL